MTRHAGAFGLLPFALATALACGCASPAPRAPAKTSAAIAVGIVRWPADPAQAEAGLGCEVERRLTASIRQTAPEIELHPQRAVRDMLFPLLEPGTQPATEEAFAALLAREDVHARLVSHGLRYLIAFAGGTREADAQGAILCGAGFGAGGCFGFMWQGETTTLDAALWPLDGGAGARHESANVEGTFVMPAFVLPVPIPARTEAAACRQLGERIGETIRQMESDRSAPAR